MRGLAALLLLALATPLAAQQVPQYTQYVFNHFNVNPAVAGSKDCLDIKLGYRSQWVGLDGAPTTAWASVYGVLKPKGKPYQANRHGLGMLVEADDTGPLGYSLFYLAYAYHIQMSKDYYFSAGLFAGMKQFKVDAGRMTLGNYNDPAIDGDNSVLVYPEVVPGIWMYNKVFWAGLSIHGLLNNNIDGVGIDSRLSRHAMLSGGYKLRIGKSTSLTPSTLLKISGGSPVAMDLNMMVEWKRTFGVGVGYRNTDAVVFMAKIGFLKYFALGYSYDVTTSKLRVASSNSHEIILSITPCPPNDPNKNIVRCPAFE
jgi:type IX secretion system PorP/SprF family membrane protein